jgi:hypothetical protein
MIRHGQFTPLAKLEDTEKRLKATSILSSSEKKTERYGYPKCVVQADIKDHLLTVRKVDIAVTSPGSLFEDKKQMDGCKRGRRSISTHSRQSAYLHLSKDNGYVKV